MSSTPNHEPNQERELLWLRRVRDLSQRLAAERDPAQLLESILDAAIELTEAERGFLVRVSERPGGGLDVHVEVARGFDQTALQQGSEKVSQTVVGRVLKRDERGLVTTSEDDLDILDVPSVQARRVRSIACVPLRLRGATQGVLYLDHRFTQGAFTESDLPILRSFADHAALALETARLLADGTPSLDHIEDLRAQHDGEAEPAATPKRFGGLVGRTPAMGALYEEIERAARSTAPVLLLGERGSGRELAAQEIHQRGARASEPFLSVNCAARDPEDLESELLGHKKGARPSATSDRRGLFVLAGKGTVLLKEVEALPLALQAKLLPVLDDDLVCPTGGKPQRIASRAIAVTSADLLALVAEGRFREDLYYRLDVTRVIVPPLRQRRDDLPLLIEHLWTEHSGEGAPKLSPRARELLAHYSWPGNVRELENEVQRLVQLGAATISAQQLSPAIQEGRGVPNAPGLFAGMTLSEGVQEVERQMLEAALADNRGNKSRAARQLGVPRSTLYFLLDRHGLG